MIDIEEMMKRAQEASEAASKQLNEDVYKRQLPYLIIIIHLFHQILSVQPAI